jgi:hypothetical protein
MARGSNHPYIPSAGMLVQTFSQLRKMFPTKVDAEILQKLSIAPKNETMVISTLKFLGFLDDQGAKTEKAKTVFLKHDEKAFAAALQKAVTEAYARLFDELGNNAWTSDRNTLISFFRVHDETSALTATRQAIAFETLAALAGRGTSPTVRPLRTSETQSTPKKERRGRKTNTLQEDETPLVSTRLRDVGAKDIGLTVRIEINLPAQGDQQTYDRIFESIKKNLLNG